MKKAPIRNAIPTKNVAGARILLLRHASRGEKLTYGELMRRFHISRGRPLVGLISAVDRLEYSAKAPGFAAIIVRKDTGFPGGGFFCDSSLTLDLRRSPSGASNPKLSRREKEFVRRQQREIWDFYGRPRA